MDLDRGTVELLPLNELVIPRTLLSLYVTCVAFMAGGVLSSVFLELSASCNCTPLVALRVYRLSAAKGAPAYAGANFGAVLLGVVNLTRNDRYAPRGRMPESIGIQYETAGSLRCTCSQRPRSAKGGEKAGRMSRRTPRAREASTLT